MKATFYLKDGPGKPWREVTETEYVAAERAAGFQPKPEMPDGTHATGSFSIADGVSGKVRYDLRGVINPVFNAVEQK